MAQGQVLDCAGDDEDDWLDYTLLGNLGVDYPDCVVLTHLDCKAPIIGNPVYSFELPFCDPDSGSCQMFADLSVTWPGRGDENPPFGTIANAIELFNSSGGLLGACGGSTILSQDLGSIRVKASVSCSSFNASMKLRFRTCLGAGSPCEKYEDRFVDFDFAAGCKRPPTFGCGDGDSAAAGVCCVGPGGGSPAVGAGSPSGQSFDSKALGGAASVGPVGASATLPKAAPPGMSIRYFFGGVGGPGYPENPSWPNTLAMFWTHDFAERIVPSPDDSHVWLITKSGSFREYFDLSVSGYYEQRIPSDEPRSLERLAPGNGWALHGLDGSRTQFLENGLWDRNVDRNGKATIGSYSGGAGRLTSVSFPDGRTLAFNYNPVHGKLDSIVDTGNGGSPTRTWSYVWTIATGTGSTLDQRLIRVVRPDGTRVALSYDTAFPAHLNRLEQQGSSGTPSRVDAAWDYDANGNLLRTWRGATTFADPLAWDKFSWTYPSATQTQVTDPYGNVTTYVHEPEPESGKQRVTSVSGPCPRCGLSPNATIAYDNPANPGHPLRPWKVTNGEGTTTELTYDEFGQVVERTEALANPTLERTTFYEYDIDFPAFLTLLDRPSVVAGCASSRQTARSYDGANGNLESETRLGCAVVGGVGAALSGDVTTYDYSGTTSGAPTSIDPPGYAPAEDVTTFDFDDARGDQLLLSRTDPLVGTTSFTNDGFGRRITTTDVNGIVTTTAYDLLDRVTSVTREGIGSTPDEVTSYFYTPYGDIFCIKDPEGRTTAFGYDTAGRNNAIVKGTGVASPQYPTLCNNSSLRRERTFHSDFDAAGRPLVEEQQFCANSSCPSPTPWTTESRTEYVYSSACHLDQVKRAKTLSPLAFAITEYGYDCNGNLESVWDANHPSSGPASTVYRYDALDRLVETRQPWGPTAASCDTLTPNDPDCAITTFGYDDQDHLTSVTDPEGNVTTYVYDDRDVLTSQQSAASGLTEYEYNLHRELVKETDARGVVTLRTMDAADRIDFVDYPGTELDVDYLYGTSAGAPDYLKGRLERATRGPAGAEPIVLDYKYDLFGRMRQDGQIARTFDKNGNPKTVTYPGNVVATYSYDFANRPATLSVNPGSGSVNLVTAATYKSNGPLATLTFGSSPARTETRTYDGRYLPLTVSVSNSLFNWSYSLDNVGNVTTISQSQPTSHTRSFSYQDYQYFLTCAAGPWSAGGGCNPVSGSPLRWTFDKIGNRLTEIRSGVTDTYNYVANGSGGRTPLLDSVTLGVGGARDYTYGPAGHLELLEAGANVVNFENDVAGQLGGFSRAVDRDAQLRYDGRGYLAAILTLQPGSGDAGVAALGLETIFADGFEAGDVCEWSTVVGWEGGGCPGDPVESLEEVVYDSAGRLHAILPDAGNDPNFVFYFGDRPVATWRGGPMASFTLLTTDHLGTPVHAMTTTGAALWSGGFEPYGRDFTIPSAASAGIFLRLPGQWNDGSWSDASLGTEVYYNVARWLDVSSGRYLATDPLGILPPERNDFNLFRYGRSSPMSFMDPLGLDAFTEDTGVQDCMYCIFYMAGRGFANSEEGFWLTCDGGKLGCSVWPSTHRQGNSQRSTTESGPKPPNACGIFHTHPRKKQPEPSACEGCDVSVAEAAGIPIYVVHPTGIFKYDPTSNKITQEAGGDWHKEPKKRCKKPCDGLLEK